MTTGQSDGAAPDGGRRRRSRRKARGRRVRTSSGRLYPYVKATERRKGYVDLKVKRRSGPVCETCGRRHYPFQDCWAGPESVKRDRSALRAEALAATRQAEAQRKRVVADQEKRARVAAQGPQWVRPPRQREGLRRIG